MNVPEAITESAYILRREGRHQTLTYGLYFRTG